ncbi:MAG: alpha/beta hydrolase [Alphaproteobacteria bacterium]|nr:alpha/beta hydrolase [Alphaproteobacteria bacterium]
MPQVQANHLTIEYEDFGPKNGPVVLLIMGLAAQMTFWPDAMIKSFVEAGFRVVRFDNRDIGLTSKVHGKRAPHPIAHVAARFVGIKGLAPYTLHDMVADTVGLMDALQIKKAHLVGVSMGGMISQLMSGTRPERVASLTSIMSGTLNPRLPGPSTRIASALFLSRPKGNSRDELIARAIEMYSLIRTNDPDDDHAELKAKITQGFDRSYYPSGVRRQLAAIIATGDLRPHLKNVTAPTLVIHGAQDPLASVEGGKDSARNIKGAQLEIIDGMAHDLPKKQLPKITQLIITHVKSAEANAAKSKAA